MNQQDINLYLAANAKYFEPSAIPLIKAKLEQANDAAFLSLQACQLIDPTVILIVSLFLGTLGIDRFMLGDTGMGILKLLTWGGCGILTIIDWFTVMNKAKQKNLETISMII